MQRFEEHMVFKKYIDVITLIGKDGKLRPLKIIWDQENCYPIDHIYSVKNGTSVVGGCGLRYECSICGNRRLLFYERDRWFMESEKP